MLKTTVSDLSSWLATHRLFLHFPPETLDTICAGSEVRQYESGETILRRGEPGRFLGVIVEGLAQAQTPDGSGGWDAVHELAEGDHFGEASLLSGDPVSEEIRAVIPSQVLLVPYDVMFTALATQPEALRHMARIATQRMRGVPAAAPVSERAVSGTGPTSAGHGPHATDARVLVVEAHPTRLLYSYMDVNREVDDRHGSVEGLGEKRARHMSKSLRGKSMLVIRGTPEEAARSILATLSAAVETLPSPQDLTVIAHRFTYGGEAHRGPAVIDEPTLAKMRETLPSAWPETLPSVETAEMLLRLAPDVPQVAVFDTAFHQTLPPQAYLYGLPYELYRESGIRKHGSHGLSHHQVALLAAAHLGGRVEDLRLVSCCMGRKTLSVCAIDRGRSAEVSSGLADRGGLLGPGWAGDLSPSIVFRIARERGFSIEQAEAWLGEQSGLCGLAGVSGDLGTVLEAAREGSSRALLAADLFAHNVRKHIGAYLAVMGGLEAIVFTGPLGATDPEMRERICERLSGLGINLDPSLNRAPKGDTMGVCRLSPPWSPVHVLVAPTNPYRMAASEALRALGRGALAAGIWARRRPIPISISAHHVHLTQEHVEALFGAGYELQMRGQLSQTGQFAAEETVTLEGPKGLVERVRVLGPVRPVTQAEISRTEAYKLGIDAPIRPSGSLEETPGVTLEGPEGTISVDHGVIIAARHVHMSPEDALHFGVRDREHISVRVEGGRGMTFRDVLIRVHPDFRLDMHVDTDEGNAAELTPDSVGYMEGIERDE